MAAIDPLPNNPDVHEMSEPSYPYGTQLTLEGDVADNVGATQLPVNALVKVSGSARVIRKTAEEDSVEGVETTVYLQLTELSLSPAEVDRVTQLYTSTGQGE